MYEKKKAKTTTEQEKILLLIKFHYIWWKAEHKHPCRWNQFPFANPVAHVAVVNG